MFLFKEYDKKPGQKLQRHLSRSFTKMSAKEQAEMNV